MSDWGWVSAGELERVVLISPHSDDAVLSCGRFLAAHPGVTVITVFAGIPARYPDPPSWWSTLCGFAPGDDIVAARRAEDVEALGVLGATPEWLDLLESMFRPDGPDVTPADVAGALGPRLRDLDPTMVLAPLGLANPEHVCVHDAVVQLRAEWLASSDEPAWICYEDIAYNQIPGQLAWRVAKLFKAALWPTPVAMPVDELGHRKREAMAKYVSQVKGLEADWGLWARLDAPMPEQYWRLAPPPPGWELMIDLV